MSEYEKCVPLFSGSSLPDRLQYALGLSYDPCVSVGVFKLTSVVIALGLRVNYKKCGYPL